MLSQMKGGGLPPPKPLPKLLPMGDVRFLYFFEFEFDLNLFGTGMGEIFRFFSAPPLLPSPLTKGGLKSWDLCPTGGGSNGVPQLTRQPAWVCWLLDQAEGPEEKNVPYKWQGSGHFGVQQPNPYWPRLGIPATVPPSPPAVKRGLLGLASKTATRGKAIQPPPKQPLPLSSVARWLTGAASGHRPALPTTRYQCHFTELSPFLPCCAPLAEWCA